MSQRSSSPGPATVVVATTILAVLLLAGCSPASRSTGVSTVPQPAPVAEPEPEPEPIPVEPAVELLPPFEDPNTPALEDPAALDEATDESLADLEVAPEEKVTESPLDELAEVDPEVVPDDLDKSREMVTAKVPTFDIPMEINDRVLAWVDIYSGNLKQSFEGNLARSGRYMEMFRRIFREEGLPEDLVYMAAVESGYKTSAYSRAKARGIFQFIASTARMYDLRVDYWVDERSDPEKSARAAAAYMKKLYAEFGDWYLALAAYNAGEGKIRRALARSGHRDFWSIAKTRHIRRETKNHVPAILAATLISKEPGKYGLRYTPDPPIRYDSVQVEGAVDLRVLARCAGTDVATMRNLNPALRRIQTPPDGVTDVRVPLGTGPATVAALELVPQSERVLYALHKVRRGDTLSALSKRYGVNVRAIQDTNGMGRRTLIRVNQTLRIPTSAASQYASGSTGAPSVYEGDVLIHRVRRGDTLSAIARRYGTTSNTIAAVNGISTRKLLQIGERLKVVPGVRTPSVAQRVAAGGGSTVTTTRTDDGRERLVHTVRRGDTLWRIASIYDTTVKVLCSLNQITPSTIIHPGKKLTVGYR